MGMGKTVPETKRTEWKGIDRITDVVHQMGCIWRGITKDDFGLDGEIEVVTPKPNGTGSETTGGIVKVQAKSGTKYVVQDTDTAFASPVEEKDLTYWHKCTFPVLYIVYHPGDEKLYFKEVKQYIKETLDVFQRPFRIRFDKTKDCFGPTSKDAVCYHASVSPPRISFTEKERLFSNLLLVRQLPERILSSKDSEAKLAGNQGRVRGKSSTGLYL